MKNLLLFIYLLIAFIFPSTGGMNILDIVNLFISIFVLLDKKMIKNYKTEVYFLVFLSFFSFILLCIDFIFNNNECSVYYQYRMFRLFSVFLTSIFIVKSSKDNKEYLLSKGIPYVFVVHAIIIISQYFNIFGCKKYILALTTATKDIDALSETGEMMYRVSGFFGGFDSANIFSSLGVLFLVFSNRLSKLFKIIGIFLLLVSMFMSARIGFYALIIVFIMFNLYKTLSDYRLFVKKIIMMFLVCGLIVGLAYYISGMQSKNILYYSLNRFTEPVRNLIENGEFKSSSSNTLFKYHYHLPENLRVLFMGHTFRSHQMGNFFFRSDVEIIKMIYGNGIIFTILFYVFILYMFINNFIKNKIKESMLYTLSLILLFIGIFKGEYMLCLHIINYYILLYVIVKEKYYEFEKE
ncbi:MAG: hypothetical protein WBG43_06345 [Marinifilaceae bacterium]